MRTYKHDAKWFSNRLRSIGDLRSIGEVSRRLGDSVMRSSLTCALLIVVLAGPAAAQPIVRDHREPGAAAQWTVDGGAVDSLDFHRLFNTQRRKHLGGSASSQAFEDTPPG